MNRVIIIVLVISALLISSCGSRRNKVGHKDMIPEKELVSILTDVYLADGLLTLPHVTRGFESRDSLNSYIQIIENHGYSKETMDITMKYYFLKKPKRLIALYDQVLNTLSEMEVYLEKDSAIEEADSRNAWKGSKYFLIPDSLGFESPRVVLNLYSPGTWTFYYTVTVFPDDQSLNPRLFAYSCSADSIETGKRVFLKTLNYIRDGKPHDYTLDIKVPTNRPTSFSCLMYIFDNNPESLSQNAVIENLSVMHKSLQE